MNGNLMNVYADRQLNPLHGCAVGVRFIFRRWQQRSVNLNGRVLQANVVNANICPP